VLLDTFGKIWKLNIEDDEVSGSGEERVLQVSSVEGREVHIVSAGKDFTVSICKTDDVKKIKQLGESAGESLDITSYRKIGSSRIDFDFKARTGDF